MSELIGTYILVLVGPGTIIAVSLFPTLSQVEAFAIIAFSFGTTVAFIVGFLGRVSGAHIDPAITVAHLFHGKTSRGMVLPYISSQLVGALLAGLTLRTLSGSAGMTVNLGSTSLQNGVGVPAGILLEAAGTFVLASCGFLASSRISNRAGESVFIGIALFVIIIVLGPLTNASLNPARSLGPAVASGYFTNLYVYMIGPLAGGSSAGLVFDLLSRK